MSTKSKTRTLCALALAALCSTVSHAFNTILVNVTVNSSSTSSGAWDEWWGKPDQFVVFYGEGDNSQAPACRSSTVINLMYVGPPAPSDWSCSFQVQRPGRLYIGLYDGDGPNSDNTAGQQIDVAPGTAKAAMANVEALSANPGTAFTFTSAGDDGTINYTVSARIVPGAVNTLTATRTSFSPAAGEQIVFTGGASGAPYTRLAIKGVNSAGTAVWNLNAFLDDPGELTQTFVWQGRDANGQPLPPGTYTVSLQAYDVTTGAVGTGTPLTRSIQILPPPTLPSLSVQGISPSPKWAPDVGDLSIRIASSATTYVTGEVYSGTTCTGTKLMNLPSITVAPGFPGTMTWAGPVLTGGAFPLGPYRIKLTGTSNGSPTLPAQICAEIEMTAAASASLFMQHLPFLAEPGKTVELTARSVDSTGAPRVAGKLDVWASIQSVGGAPPPAPTAPLRTCTMASSCTAVITLPAGDSFFSWRATASDRAGTTIATHGWRGQRVMNPANFANAVGSAVVTDAALTGPFMANTKDSARAFDLVFTVSTDFDWNNASDRKTISDGLDRFMTRLWGIEGFDTPAPTTFLARPDLVKVFLAPERRAVSWNPADNLCDWTVPQVAWANATAILHKTNCRDNAYTSSRSFSAKLLARDVIFHELHHALFGLSDEYSSGTGGYFEASPFPNVYNLLSDCTAQVGREPGGCSMITEIDRITGMPTGRTFFRMDASLPDATVNNGTQRFGDIRRANWMEGVCDAGGC